MSQPDPHRCLSGRACRTPDRTNPNNILPGLTRTPDSLCDSCLHRLGTALDNLRADYHTVDNAVTQTTNNGITQHVSGTPEPSIPINIHMDRLRRQIGANADDALHHVCPQLGIQHPAPWKGPGYPHRYRIIIDAAHNILPANQKLLCSNLDGVNIAIRIINHHRQIQCAHGDPNPRKRLALPCPLDSCGAHHSLGINNGETDVTCTKCGGRWTEREYSWLAGLVITDIKERNKTMLEWLLAEANWKLQVAQWLIAEERWRIHRARSITQLKDVDLAGISGATVVALLVEQIGDTRR